MSPEKRTMASIEDGSGVPADTGNMWASQSAGKVTRRRVIVAGAVLGASALGLGLFFGLQKDSQETQRNIITGQDLNSEGCFKDTAADRVMTAQLTDKDLTPTVRER